MLELRFRDFGRRNQELRANPIGPGAVAYVGVAKLDHGNIHGGGDRRLVMKPGAGRQKNKKHDGNDCDIVGPRATLVGPEDNSHQDAPDRPHDLISRHTVDNNAVTHMHYAVRVSCSFRIVCNHHDRLP